MELRILPEAIDTECPSTRGISIGVVGYAGNPQEGTDAPTCVYVEKHQGRVLVHVWDGTAAEPSTHVIPARRGRDV